MLSPKNKKQKGIVFFLALFIFSGVLFLTPTLVHAEEGGIITNFLDSTVGLALRGLLYAFFVVLGWMTSMAVTLFEWAITPEYISGNTGLLNKASVYANWKFIRDFFNLFFILTLLYTAFTIVFQVAKDYKKTLLSIVLAALFVNFSFPLTRVIIDMTNVPMYYFVNQISAKSEGKSAFGNFLGASKIQDALIPESYSVRTGSTSQLMVAIIMLFLFMISLLVLAVLMVVRLVALVILLIFASVGFAASVIPGMEEYGNKWWKALWNYTLFGPASMLMLYIATRFFQEIGKDSSSGQFLNAALKNATPDDSRLIASMAMFSVPIIMMWFAIGLATSFSIAGAGAITGQGQKFAKWAGRKTYNNRYGRGIYEGAKKGLNDGKIGGWKYGDAYKNTRLAKLIPITGKASKEQRESVEARIKGTVYGGKDGRQTEADKLHSKRVNEAVKENKENQVNRSNLLKGLESGDLVTRQAAAMSLAEIGELRTADDLKKAILAIRSEGTAEAPQYNDGASDMVLKAIDKAKDGATAGISPALYHQIAESKGGYQKNEKGEYEVNKQTGERVMGSTLEALDAKLKKDGNIHVKVDYKIAEEIQKSEAAGVRMSPEVARDKVYDKMVLPLSAEDLVKQSDLHKAPGFKEYYASKLADKPGRVQAIYDKAMEKGKPQVQEVWRDIMLDKRARETAEREAQSSTEKDKAERERLHEKMQQAKQATANRKRA